jgi:3-methyladenine DNA glycosylase/8-oxoguanine DNA glycosylase
MELFLTAHPPFSLPAVAESHGWAALAPFAWDEEAGVLAYVAHLDAGRVVEMCVRKAPDGVRVEVDDDLNADEEAQVTHQATWMLDLDHDLTPFYALAREEPRLAQVEAQAKGRLLRSPTLFEDTVKTILTTNTAWSGTIRMASALVAQFGDPLPGDPARHAFPRPERLAASDEETLRAETRLGYRAPYVLGLARSVASGDLDLEAFKSSDLPAGQLYKELLAIKGVGGYAAAHLLMLLGRYDFLPIDSWAKTAVSREWHGGEPVGAAEVEAAFACWGEWKGLAFWFWDWSPWDEA